MRYFSTYLVLIFVIVVGVTKAFSLGENDPRIFDYDVKSYTLSIGFNVPNKTFGGNVIMTAQSLSGLDTVVLNASNSTLTIDSVFFGGKPVRFLHESDHLKIIPSSRIALNHPFQVQIYYNGVSNFHGEYENGGVLFDNVEGTVHIATSSQPYYARTWWPCKDVPNDKAFMSVNITVPSNLTAVSTGLLKNISRNDSTLTFQWATEYPIATYLVSVSAAIYRQYTETYTGLDGKKMKVAYYIFPEYYNRARKDFEHTVEILKFFSEKFCEYPFINEKFGFVEVPGNITMEHQTIVSVSSEIITGDQQHELTFVHEISHHWFGNLVTPVNWKHTWLNEGFATYAEALWLEHKQGTQAYHKFMFDLMNIDMGQYAGSVIGQSDTSFWDSFSPRVYRKGAIVLHMLRGLVGDTAFFTILHNYINNDRYRYGNVTTEDFIKECENVYGKSLKWFFDEWVYAYTDSTDRPRYELSWNDSSNNAHSFIVNVIVKQTNAKILLYRMPMMLTISSLTNAYDFTVQNTLPTEMFTFTVPEKPHWVEIDKDAWIFKDVSVLEKGR